MSYPLAPFFPAGYRHSELQLPAHWQLKLPRSRQIATPIAQRDLLRRPWCLGCNTIWWWWWWWFRRQDRPSGEQIVGEAGAQQVATAAGGHKEHAAVDDWRAPAQASGGRRPVQVPLHFFAQAQQVALEIFAAGSEQFVDHGAIIVLRSVESGRRVVKERI